MSLSTSVSWSHLEEPVRAPLTAPIAKWLFRRAISRLPVTVRIEGKTLGQGGPEMVVHRPDELFARLGRDRLVGFGGAYLTGAWEAEDLSGFLAVLASEIRDLVPQTLRRARAAVATRVPTSHHGHRGTTQEHVAHHYDLSNDLFSLFLDPSLAYSCALFQTDAEGSPIRGDDLWEAQQRKINALLDLAGVQEGTRVLEIGSGWGELAIRAARRGAYVRTITLSVEQQQLARERVSENWVSGLVEVDLCDYRDVDGQYDAVISVEMIEAIGWRYWTEYLQTIDRVLAPGGRAAIQAITMPHDQMLSTRDELTWINKYIFPGGFLPSVEALEEAARDNTSLRLTERRSIGPHYAETLRQWDERFAAAKAEVEALGFDEIFQRMWHFYLEYCRAGFMSGYLDDYQLVFTREAG